MKIYKRIFPFVFFVIAVSICFIHYKNDSDNVFNKFFNLQEISIEYINQMNIEKDICVIKGDDAYIIFKDIDGFVGDFELRTIMNSKKGDYTIYLDTGSGFNEKDQVPLKQNAQGYYVGSINKKIEGIRLDFDSFPDGSIVKVDSLFFNTPETKIVKKTIYMLILLLIIFFIYVYVVFRKDKSSGIECIFLQIVRIAMLFGLFECLFKNRYMLSLKYGLLIGIIMILVSFVIIGLEVEENEKFRKI